MATWRNGVKLNDEDEQILYGSAGTPEATRRAMQHRAMNNICDFYNNYTSLVSLRCLLYGNHQGEDRRLGHARDPFCLANGSWFDTGQFPL